MGTGTDMSEPGDVEIFQRWLQAKLAATDHIEDPEERQRRRTHIESAISEAISFRDSLQKLESLESPSPFIERDSAVRSIENRNELVTSNDSNACPKCSAMLLADLDFCPVCGEEI